MLAAPQELHVYLDFKLDESYTPTKLSIRAGAGAHDLKVGVQHLLHHAVLC